MALMRKQSTGVFDDLPDPLEDYGGVYAGVETPEPIPSAVAPATTTPSRPRPPETPPVGTPVPRNPEPPEEPEPPEDTFNPDWYWGIGPDSTNPNELKAWQAVGPGGFDPSKGITPEVLASIQNIWPGATLGSSEYGLYDKVNIPGLGLVDLVRNTQYTDRPIQWWYGLESPKTPTTSGGGGGGGGGGTSLAAKTDLGEQYAGPGSPGVFTESPVQQVGQDPLSLLVSGGLVDLLDALAEPGAAEQLLLDRAAQGDAIPEDLQAKLDQILADLQEPSEAERLLLERGRSDTIPTDVLQRRMESVRENAERVRRSETDTLRAQLADRGLVSVSGAPQGAEWTGLSRISEALASQQYTALRDISTDLMEQYAQESLSALQSAAQAGSTRADQALAAVMAEVDARSGRAGEALEAMTAAAAAGNARAQNILSTLAEITDRQQMLSEVALRNLENNMAWNRFLAEFGLQRDMVMEELRQGRLTNVLAIISQFYAAINAARGGYV